MCESVSKGDDSLLGSKFLGEEREKEVEVGGGLRGWIRGWFRAYVRGHVYLGRQKRGDVVGRFAVVFLLRVLVEFVSRARLLDCALLGAGFVFVGGTPTTFVFFPLIVVVVLVKMCIEFQPC